MRAGPRAQLSWRNRHPCRFECRQACGLIDAQHRSAAAAHSPQIHVTWSLYVDNAEDDDEKIGSPQRGDERAASHAADFLTSIVQPVSLAGLCKQYAEEYVLSGLEYKVDDAAYAEWHTAYVQASRVLGAIIQRFAYMTCIQEAKRLARRDGGITTSRASCTSSPCGRRWSVNTRCGQAPLLVCSATCTWCRLDCVATC